MDSFAAGMYDLHIHTVHSPDAQPSATMESYAEKAIEMGYAGIGFTDHLEFDPADEGYGYLDYDRYSLDIDRVRKKYGDRLSIAKGVEISYQSEFSEEPKKYLKGKDFDFVIGAVHFVGRCPFHLGDAYFRGKTVEEAFWPYFAEVQRMVESGMFDVLAHLDHLKRYSIPVYGSYSAEMFEEEIDKILRAAVDSGIALEINASGFRYSFQQPFPDEKTIRKFVRLGGRHITLASDSHALPQFGKGMKESLNLARLAGLQESVTFTSRQRLTAPFTG